MPEDLSTHAHPRVALRDVEAAALAALDAHDALIDFDRVADRLGLSLRQDPPLDPLGLTERARRIVCELLDEDLERFAELDGDSPLSPSVQSDYLFLTGTFGTPPERALERVVHFNCLPRLTRRIFIMLAIKGEPPGTLGARLGVSPEEAGPLFRTAVLTILGREGVADE